MSAGLWRSVSGAMVISAMAMVAVADESVMQTGQDQAAERTVITVAGYDFPPFVSTVPYPPTGATLDLIESLNAVQDDYEFVFREITAKRRYEDFVEQRYDLILFEQPEWSWDGLDYQETSVLAYDAEIYIAHEREDRDQSFFDDIGQRKLIGYLGYHYGFAGLQSDARVLQEQFDITLSRNHRRNLQLILLDRPDVAEVAILTRSFLDSELATNPEYADKLLISETVDQRYRLRGLLQPDSNLSLESLESMLVALEEDGTLEALRENYYLLESEPEE